MVNLAGNSSRTMPETKCTNAAGKRKNQLTQQGKENHFFGGLRKPPKK